MSLPPPPTAWGADQDEDMEDMPASPAMGLVAASSIAPSTPISSTAMVTPEVAAAPFSAQAPSPWTNPLYLSGQRSSAGSRHRMNPAFTSPTPTVATTFGPDVTSSLGMDDAFGEQVQALLQGYDAVGVMEAMEALCKDRSAALRHEAAAQLHRAVRHMRLRGEAEALEGEAATWCLLRHLYVAGPVAHGGPELKGVGEAKTLRQKAAELIQGSNELDVMARVVAWLEALAGQSMDNEEALSGRAAYSGRFAAKEALWLETKSKIVRGAGNGELVRELDPDAPTREWRKLDGDNAKMQEALMAHCWKLVRAGRIEAATRVCGECGEPYRGPSWGSSSLTGMICAFPTAADTYTAEHQLAALAAEEEMGAFAAHSLCRWAAYQASEQAAEAVNKTGGGAGGGMYESAIYASLSGHTAGMLRVCQTWEDFCWAYFRSCLDLSLDKELADLSPRPMEDSRDLIKPLPSYLLPPGRRSEAAEAAAAQAGAVVAGQWPLPALWHAAPTSVEDCLSAVHAAAPSGAESIYVSLQAQLILAAASQEEGSPHGPLLELLRAQVQASLSRLTEEHARPDAVEAHLIRFAAHLLLVLEHLDAAEILMTDEGEARARDQLLKSSVLGNARSMLLETYIVQLMEDRHHKLVPLYACKLGPGKREKVYAIYLCNVEQDSLEDCAAVFELSRDCFRLNGVVGAKGEDEMHRLAEAFAADARYSLHGGPERRVAATKWLTFSKETVAAAIVHVNAVCHSLLLGCGGRLAASLAQTLLHGTLLPALDEAGGMQELMIQAQARGSVSRNDMLELTFWQSFYQAEAKAQDWEATYGQQLLAGAVDKGEAAASASAAANLAATVVGSGWMRAGLGWERSPSWERSPVKQDRLELRLVPAAICEPSKEEFVAMSEEMASQLAEELQRLWTSELEPWWQQQFGREVGASFNAQTEPQDAGDGSVVLACLKMTAQPGVSLATPSVTTAVGKLVSSILKGEAPASPDHVLYGVPLLAVTCRASQPMACALSRHVAVPRLLLRAAKLRAEAARLQGGLQGLPDIAVLVADPKDPLHSLMTVEQLKELLEYERRAVIEEGSTRP